MFLKVVGVEVFKRIYFCFADGLALLFFCGKSVVGVTVFVFCLRFTDALAKLGSASDFVVYYVRATDGGAPCFFLFLGDFSAAAIAGEVKLAGAFAEDLFALRKCFLSARSVGGE